MRKLKVFEAQMGFYDTVVAAPSRTAALRAWGTRQDLFASGQARVSNDVDAAAVAIKNPEKPLRRAFGSKEPYLLMPAELPTIPAAATNGNVRERRRLVSQSFQWIARLWTLQRITYET